VTIKNKIGKGRESAGKKKKIKIKNKTMGIGWANKKRLDRKTKRKNRGKVTKKKK